MAWNTPIRQPPSPGPRMWYFKTSTAGRRCIAFLRYTVEQRRCLLLRDSRSVPEINSSGYPPPVAPDPLQVVNVLARGAIDEAVSLTSFERSIRGAPLRPAPFQRRGCEPLSALLGPRGAFTEYRRSLTLSWSPAGTPESVSETARSAGRLSYALAGRELSRTLTCKPKDPGTPDPCESDAQQPESAFRRIQNLRACTRRPIKRVNR
jgi:hypothetical protein